jgi:hypothetical protein
MTEAEWLNCTDPVAVWEPLRGTVSERKHRLFVCACCRLWHRDLCLSTQRALDAAERAADGLLDWEGLAAAEDEAIHAMLDGASDRAFTLAGWALWPHPGKSSGALVSTIRNNERQRHVQVIRELFGNPFRPASVAPRCLSWNDGTVPRIAQSIYAERAFERMPVLADALEDAGCDDADILAHCREPGPHVRGCWVVDLLLGKC